MKKAYEITQFSNLREVVIKNREVPVPSIEIFRYIYEKAQAGNEMAAAQIFEWMKFCSPKNRCESQVYNDIYHAFRELFKQ